MPDPESLLATGAGCLGLDLSEDDIGKLMTYLHLLSRWNRRYNLTAITELSAMVTHHLLDSLSIDRFLRGSTLLDVGSGAGLPGIPLALLKPEMNFTLLDSNGKKERFMLQACIELGMANVNVINSRIESYQGEGSGFDKGFDNIVCRAFGDHASFRRLTEGLINEQGQLLAMKGRIDETEKGVDEGWTVHQLKIPFIDDQRHLLVWRGHQYSGCA